MPAKPDAVPAIPRGATTEGHLLGGRVRYVQPLQGFRSGIEPVLLAAAIPARPGQRVLEAGSGAGAALLCLAARLPGIAGVGVERDPTLVALAEHNRDANGFASLGFITADVTHSADLGRLDQLGRFDHACANPPYHPAGTASPFAGREVAKRAHAGLFAQWIAALAGRVRPGGTLTLVLASGAVPDCLAAMRAADCGSPALLPLWPKLGRPAKLLLLHGVKHGRGAFRLLPGLVLHEAGGGFTAMADAILRGAAPLSWDAA
jgi:tRNA1Val (adenine37-N6)-methyltransferase